MKIVQYGDKKRKAGLLPKMKKYKLAKIFRELMITDDIYCEICGIKEDLTLDHIIPCCILRDLGITNFFEHKENLRIVCKYHNLLKKAKIDIEDSRTIPLLKMFIQEYETNKKTIKTTNSTR